MRHLGLDQRLHLGVQGLRFACGHQTVALAREQHVAELQLGVLQRLPKIVPAVVVLAITGPWMLTTLVEYIQRTLMALPAAVG